MKRPTVEPIDEARPMGLDELFFSETDQRGMIRFGNRVFTRVAGFTLDEMVGRPHNIVRHPHMPRAVFGIFWERLLKGEPVVAYVKNLATDGRHYWVLAAAMPAGDGFVSIRLKPSSPLFEEIRSVYARTLAVEQAALDSGATQPVARDQGALHLLEEIKRLGFDSYDRFMRSALITELGHRDELLSGKRKGRAGGRGPALAGGRKAHGGIPHSDPHRNGGHPVGTEGGDVRSQAELTDRLKDIHRTCNGLTERLADLVTGGSTLTGLRGEILPRTQAILQLGGTIRLLALNAEIESSRLGEVARALRAIAEQLRHDATAGNEIVHELADRLRALLDPIEELMFDVVLATLKVEMVGVFVGEILARGIREGDDRYRSVVLLVETFLHSAENIVPALEGLEDRLADVDVQMSRLRRFLQGLSYVQLTGRIESNRNEQVAVFRVIFESAEGHIRGSISMLEKLHGEISSAHLQLQRFADLDQGSLARLRAVASAAT